MQIIYLSESSGSDSEREKRHFHWQIARFSNDSRRGGGGGTFRNDCTYLLSLPSLSVWSAIRVMLIDMMANGKF